MYSLKTPLVILFLCALLKTYAQDPGPIYCGDNYTSSKAVSLSGASNKVISNLKITDVNGEGIFLNNCNNIIIEKNIIENTKGVAIRLLNCTNITIRDNRISNMASGVYAIQSKSIKVINNSFLNANGPYPRGQMVQFDKVTGPDNKIAYNVMENILGKSYPEDVINLYKTYGTAESPVIIDHNWIRGGGPSKTGGGIMTGDNGGAHVVVSNNILVDPGQYGIAAASGTHIKIINNKVYGKKQYFTNVGIYAWNQYSYPMNNITIKGNDINYANASGWHNPVWFAGNAGHINGRDENNKYAKIDASILPATLITSCESNKDENSSDGEDSDDDVDEDNEDDNQDDDNDGDEDEEGDKDDKDENEDNNDNGEDQDENDDDEVDSSEGGAPDKGDEAKPVIDYLPTGPSNPNKGAQSCGTYEVSEALILDGVSGKTITDLQIDSASGHGITLRNCTDITLTKLLISNVGKSGINLIDCKNITISDVRINMVQTGIEVTSSTGVKIINNTITQFGGSGGGQGIILKKAFGDGNIIVDNILEISSTKSGTKQFILIDESSGTATSPIAIHENWLRGTGAMQHGGGLFLGVNGGSYQVAARNRLVNTGPSGMQVLGGNEIYLLENKLFSQQRQHSFMGLYAENKAKTSPSKLSIKGNEIHWKNHSGDGKHVWLQRPTFSNLEDIGNPWGIETITAAILPAELYTPCETEKPAEEDESSGDDDDTAEEEEEDEEEPADIPDEEEEEEEEETPTAPVVVSDNKGAQFCGPYTASEALSLNGVSGKTISGLEINNASGNAVTLKNCSELILTNLSILDPKNTGIVLENCKNITIINTKILKAQTGIQAISSTGVVVVNTTIKEFGGDLGGQGIVFRKAYGAGNSISNNIIENTSIIDGSKDFILIEESNGTAESPIIIEENWMRGTGAIKQGAGFCLGSKGGSYQIASKNRIVNTGRAGMLVYGGNEISVLENEVYSEQREHSFMGIFAVNNANSRPSQLTIKGNLIQWLNNKGDQKHVWLQRHTFSKLIDQGNAWGSRPITAAILPTELDTPCEAIGTEDDTEVDAGEDEEEDVVVEEEDPVVDEEEEKPVVEEGISLYPNPTDHLTNLKLTEDIITSGEVRFKMFNLYGRKVHEIPIKNKETQIGIGFLEKGLYQYFVLLNGEIIKKGQIGKI